MSEESKGAQSSTYSVRTSGEVMDDISALLERTGMSQKELFSAMVTQFKANLMVGSSEQTEDMLQLRYHLNHSEAIFSNMIQKLQDLKNGFTEQIEKEKQVHQGVIEQVEKSRLQAEAERDLARKELVELQERSSGLFERNNELEAAQKANHVTIELLTQQKSALESRIADVAALEAEVHQLRLSNAESQQKAEKLHAELEAKGMAIVTLQNAHSNEVSSIQKMAELQIRASAIEADNKVLEATTKLKDEYVSRIDVLQEKIQTLTARIHELELNETRRDS